MDPDRLAALEEERRFLLRSLADLEREHAAGDIDADDYRALRDGYTVRTAATMRAIDAGRAALPRPPRVDWRRRLLAAGLVVAAAVTATWVLIESSAERAGSDAADAPLDADDAFSQLIAQARLVSQGSPGDAAALYAAALELRPDDVEARTYFAWTLALDSRRRSDELGAAKVDERLSQAAELLRSASASDPGYADPKCFLAVVTFRFRGDTSGAAEQVAACQAANPPADVRALVDQLAADIAAAEASGAATTVASG